MRKPAISRRLRKRFLRNAPLQGTLPFFAFDVSKTLASARKCVPAYQGPDPVIWFGRDKTLAYIRFKEDGSEVPSIFIHDLLNSAATPEPVIEHILVHELLHLVIPSEEIEGKLVSHPPKFWAAEATASRHRFEFFEWSGFTLHSALEVNYRDECICVKRGWRKTLYNIETPIEKLMSKYNQSVIPDGTK